MPTPNFEPISNSSIVEPEGSDSLDMNQMLAALKQSQEMNYQMMRLNAWVLSETMDQFLAGFWSRFMANRQIAHKQFLQRRHPGEGSH